MSHEIQSVFKTIFTRYLKKLRKEIEAYQQEDNLWIVENDIQNSGGNLCLHLLGNLNAFICAVFGNSGYVRNRDLEFSVKDVPRTELLRQIDQTIEGVNDSIDQITSADLQADFPIQVFKEKTTTEYMIVHLATHLSYHLGQLNYHRRLIDQR